MTPQEMAAWQAEAAARAAARAKWGDGTAVIEDGDLRHFSGDELLALANAGRLEHMHVGRDKRLSRT